MAILIAMGVFIVISCTIFWVLNVLFKDRIEIQQRIKKFVVSNDKQSALIEGTLYERLFQPVVGGLNGFIGKATPKHYVQ